MKFPQTRFHDLVCYDGAQYGDDKGGGAHKEPVAGGLHRIIGIHDADGLIGNPGKQGVQGAHQQVGREPAGNTCKGCRQAGHGVAAISHEHQGADGNQHHITCVSRHIGHTAQEDHHRCDQGGRCDFHGFAQQGGYPAALFRHAYAQHGHQHGAQGREAGEVLHCIGHHVDNAVGIEQAFDGNDGVLHFTGFAVNQLAFCGNAHGVKQPGDDHHAQCEEAEEHDWVGQLIARPFHHVQEPVEQGLIPCIFLCFFFCHIPHPPPTVRLFRLLKSFFRQLLRLHPS